MATYNVTVKNISGYVDRMTLAKGEYETVRVTGVETPYDAQRVAVRRLFDGCGFYGNERYGSNATIGEITAPSGGATAIYGRIIVWDADCI